MKSEKDIRQLIRDCKTIMAKPCENPMMGLRCYGCQSTDAISNLTIQMMLWILGENEGAEAEMEQLSAICAKARMEGVE